MDCEQYKDVLVASLQAQEKFANTMNELIVRSEARMDRTNDMVNKLSQAVSDTISTLNLVTQKYCQHIDEVTSTRDAVFKQNNELIEANRQMQKSVEDFQRQNRKLIDTILTHFATSIPPTAAAITVNQHPQQ